jgi:hypothetical protein
VVAGALLGVAGRSRAVETGGRRGRRPETRVS